jgi:arsenate reductase
MKKFFHLSSCSTCIRIIKEINLNGVELQDIKTEAITLQQLEKMAELSGSYDALFSKRAMKYKSMGLKEKNLSESDIKQLIFEEYTFLKRPVLVLDHKIVIGNAKKSVEEMSSLLP